MRRPVNTPYTVTTQFGEKDSYALYGLHSGYDYAKPDNSEVYATTDGTIISNLNHPTRGYMVTLFDGKYYHRFMHNSVFKRNVGDKVKEGDLIALSGGVPGTEGAGLSTGAHVHWDMNTRGVDTNSWADFVDPDDWLKGRIPAAVQPPVITTPSLQPYQRMVRPTSSVYYRDAPNTSGNILKEFPAGDPEPINFRGWVYGENVGGNKVWFVGRFTNGYSWSGAYTDPSTNGLEDLNVTVQPPVTPPVVPPVTPPVTPPAYTFTKDVDCVNAVIPAGLGSFEYGNFPTKPEKVVIHDFGTEGRDTFTSTVNYFRKADNISAHFVVSGNRVVQMVSLTDRAYHAGSNGNNFIGIETDPAQDTETIASTRLLLQQLERKYGYRLALIEHNQIMPTLCGDDVDLADYDIHTPGTPSVDIQNLDQRVTKLESNQQKLIDVVKTF